MTREQANPKRCRAARGAFTLIETLVVISLITLLIALLLPSLLKAREHTRDVICASNQHQMAVALVTFAIDNQGWLPKKGSTPYFPSIPWHWDISLYNVFKTYAGDERIVACPLHEGPLRVPLRLDVLRPEYVNDYAFSYTYLAGFHPAPSSSGGVWYDGSPKIAVLKKNMNTSSSLLLTDLNIYAHGEGWGFVNHSVGQTFWGDNGYWLSGNATLSNVLTSLRGGNRTYVDCSVKWTTPYFMGTNDGPAATFSNGHYSHTASARPYFW